MTDAYKLTSRIVWVANHFCLDPATSVAAHQARSIRDYANDLVNTVARQIAQADLPDEESARAALALAPVPREAVEVIGDDSEFERLVSAAAGGDVFNLVTETLIVSCGDSDRYQRLVTSEHPASIVAGEITRQQTRRNEGRKSDV